MPQVVQWEIKDKVGIITLNRPEKRNAINGEVLEGIGEAITHLSRSAEVRVILLQGAGPVFSAGIDFNYLGHIGGNDGRPAGVRLREGIASIHSLLNRIEQLEKPVVAKIHGFCGGLGLELALTADFRLASETATLGVPEIILGLIPDCGGTTRLTRILGPARAKELIMTGEMIPAQRAYEIGLVHYIFPEPLLGEKTQAFIAKLLQRPPLALGLAKRVIDLGFGLDRMTHLEMEGYIQSLLITSKDFPETLQEGIAFLTKKSK